MTVVGYHGSELSRRALEYAARRVGPGGRIVLVHVVSPSADWAGGSAGLSGPSEEIRAAHLERGRSVLATAPTDELGDVQVDTLVGDGHPARVLARIAREEGAEEIVVGSRGASRLRALLGSVSHALLHEADCPVVVVPPR